MKRISVQLLMVGVVFALAFLLVEPQAWSAGSVYVQTNLVSDIPGLAQSTDPNLKNPWGNSFSATGPFWVANAGSNTSTLYQGTGSTVNARVVAVAGGPTGTVINSSTTDFVEANGRPASFLFSTLSGSIYAWNATDANNVAENAATVPNASFTGLASANNGSGNFLYATNIMGGGSVKVFNSSFAVVTLSGSFIDPNVQSGAGYVPFNIQNINGQLYVEYANLRTGAGAVAIFDANGNFIKDLVAAGESHLNSPWGVVLAPANFGSFSNDLLVGNFGDGKINAYDPATGAFLGTLTDFNGPIVNSGLWSLTVRTGGTFDPSAVYITAGINIAGGLNGPANGLLARLNAVTPSTVAIMTASQLPAGKLDSSYTQALAATGGASPYSNWKVAAGSLPPGLSLNSTTGVLTGTPTGIGGTFYFTITFSDSAGAAGSGSFQMTIQQPSTSTTSNRIGSFAQVVSGAGWKTTITLINLSASTVNAQVNFYADDGSPLTLPQTFPQFGSSTAGPKVPVTVGPNDSIVIQTNASTSPVSVGWADVQGTGALVGYAAIVLTLPGVPELDTTVPLDSRLLPSLSLPYDNTDGYRTAVALANQTATPQTITAILMDQNGGRLAASQISLPAFGHAAFFLNNQVANSTNQLGFLQFQSAGGVTGVGLRFSPTGSFTSIPIIR